MFCGMSMIFLLYYTEQDPSLKNLFALPFVKEDPNTSVRYGEQYLCANISLYALPGSTSGKQQ
jgi:hypothetical protein